MQACVIFILFNKLFSRASGDTEVMMVFLQQDQNTFIILIKEMENT